MTRSLNRFAALFVLACAIPVANAAPFGPGPGHDRDYREHRESRDNRRLEAYSVDVLRNNRKDCGIVRDARESRDGRITVDCLSNNKQRELRYVITPTHRGGSRIALLSNTPNRDMRHRDGPHR